jgi:predicted pyridoxine 5'-phosphate oxidase superfamily flavin-nucleotide-binding protein
MTRRYLDIASTPGVIAAREANGGVRLRGAASGEADRFTPAEVQFIAERDSFYLATVSSSGWPYIQHRGGPKGFLKVLDDKTLAFADFRGNRQYLSIGNVTTDDKTALFLMDYANRLRLKILVHLEVKDLSDDLALAEKLVLPGYKAIAERVVLLHLEAYDWNCPQHITQRFTEEELSHALAPIRQRQEALESENRRLRDRLAAYEKRA